MGKQLSNILKENLKNKMVDFENDGKS